MNTKKVQELIEVYKSDLKVTGFNVVTGKIYYNDLDKDILRSLKLQKLSDFAVPITGTVNIYMETKIQAICPYRGSPDSSNVIIQFTAVNKAVELGLFSDLKNFLCSVAYTHEDIVVFMHKLLSSVGAKNITIEMDASPIMSMVYKVKK